VGILRSTATTLEMIKWEHSIFALPFALCGAMLAASGVPSGRQLAWIVVAMVGARSAAMAFNRLADSQLDALNPRTRTRALPAGQLSANFVRAFVVVSSGVFALAAYELNRLAFLLSPVVLAVVLLYSYTKLFTRWSHLVLGFALGMAPAATCWVAGFDVLYACQDFAFDSSHGLYSIPRAVGIPRALLMARGFHLLTLLMLFGVLWVFQLGKLAAVGVVLVGLLLRYEHSLVRADDLSKLDAAFFTMNGVISVVFFVFVAADLLLPK